MPRVQCNLRVDEDHKKLLMSVARLMKSEPEFADRLANWLKTQLVPEASSLETRLRRVEEKLAELGATSAAQPQDSRDISSTMSGYNWRIRDGYIFIPDGSELGVRYNNRSYYAYVKNSKIIFNGTAVSPKKFIDSIALERRDPLRSIWIRMPDLKDWRIAFDCRFIVLNGVAVPGPPLRHDASALPPP